MESVHSKISGSASSRSRGWQLVALSTSSMSISTSFLPGIFEGNVRPEYHYQLARRFRGMLKSIPTQQIFTLR